MKGKEVKKEGEDNVNPVFMDEILKQTNKNLLKRHN